MQAAPLQCTEMTTTTLDVYTAGALRDDHNIRPHVPTSDTDFCAFTFHHSDA